MFWSRSTVALETSSIWGGSRVQVGAGGGKQKDVIPTSSQSTTVPLPAVPTGPDCE